MKHTAIALLCLAFLLGGGGLLFPQETQEEKKPPEREAIDLQMDPSTYDASGRRDPFKNLLGGKELKEKTDIGGVPQLYIDDVNLIGIVKYKTRFTAVLSGPQGFPYYFEVGDKLSDGFILSIGDTQVILRKTNERGIPLTKPKDIVKEITPGAFKNEEAFWLLFTTVSLGLIFAGHGYTSSSAATISKITAQPGKLNTRIVLQTDSAPTLVRTYYQAKSIILELDNVNVASETPVETAGATMVTGVRLEKTGAEKGLLQIQVREPVPYTVASDANRMIIELNGIQRGPLEGQVEPEVQRQLDQNAGAAVFMNKLNYEEREGEVEFRAKLSGDTVAQVFALEKPLRLVVDVYDAVYEEPASALQVDKFGLRQVRVSQFQLSNPRSITRMVFDLREPKYYDLRSDKDGITVSFFKEQSSLLAASDAPAPQPPVAPPPAPVVSSPKPEASPKMEAKASLSVVPVKAENGKNGKSGQETAPPKTEEIPPAQEQEQRYEPKTLVERDIKYTGEIITLKFKDADLRDVILYLGDFAKLNVVFDPEVRGVVTCNLEDVPWDQALDILLRNNKLGKVMEGNVLRIAPVSVLTREDEAKLRESKEQAGPVVVKTITLSYSKARDVMALLASKKSPRGEITIDERTNTLIISDVRENLDLLEKLLSVLDTPTPQVSIEARIVEATSTFIRNLGIQWGWRGIADPFYGNQTSLQFPNTALIDGNAIPQGIVTKGIGGPLGGYGINLPAPAFNTVVGFSFANLLDTFRLDVYLSALETAGEGRIISSPKVTTQNNQQAEIVQGRQIPVQTVANFTVTTRYVNAALELRATPQITAEGTIIMTIEIQNNAADFANLVNGIPPITTQSAKTTVMVPDGGTTVIGGIYRVEDSITRERVPFLHQIPILGNLFKSFARTKQNRELLIFMTPRIIK
jgi:type IV pilus assembly protein PilQ